MLISKTLQAILQYDTTIKQDNSVDQKDVFMTRFLEKTVKLMFTHLLRYDHAVNDN